MAPAPTAAKDARALELRARGWTHQQIADELGYANRSGALKACDRALTATIREKNEDAKALLIHDLSMAKQAVWAVLEANHITISDGRIVTLNDEPITDDEPVLRAVDRLVKIDQELAKIYGSYAPARHEVRQIDAIDAHLLDLADQVGRVEPGRTPPVSEPA